MVRFHEFLLVISINFIVIASSHRTADKMFSQIAGASCFKRLNGTHETGCSSAFGGSVGVLHLIKTVEDFDFVTKNPPAPPYAVVVTPQFFTRANIMPLKSSAFVSAIVLLKNQTNLDRFSQELQCPNQYSGLNNSTCDASNPDTLWNPFGTGLMHENFPFPIYYVADDAEIAKIVDCFEKFNSFDLGDQQKRSLCSIQINAFMSAAVNSDVCLRRTGYFAGISTQRFCDPLRSKNVYATLYPREVVEPANRTVHKDEKFIVVTSRIDTTSMFDGVGSGAMDSFVSFATLISTAHILATLLPDKVLSDNPNVLFMVFNGESYDYIGSQRFVYDVSKGNFPPEYQSTDPIGWDNIQVLIDLGTLDDLNNINVHHPHDFPKATQILQLLDKYNRQHSLGVKTIDTLSDHLPPTSAQSFLRENRTFPVVILNSKPLNRFYHSIYDDINNINFKYQNTTNDFTTLLELNNAAVGFDVNSVQMGVRNVSTVLAFTLFEMVTGGPYTGSMGGNPNLIDELMYCFMESIDCRLFHAAKRPNLKFGNDTLPQRYVSVSGSPTHESTHWAYMILGYLIGQRIEINEQNCTHLPLMWVSGVNGTGECRYTTQNLTTAYSPAFLIENYDWTSGRYSTWTESTWRSLNARIFLKPSTSHEALTLAIGFVVMTISFVFVFLVNSKSDILFGDCVSTTINTFTPPPVRC